jgi:choline dehydrogenase
VEYRREDSIQTATAKVDIIIATGAVGTPHLLMRSGVGPAQMLKEHGVDVVLDSPFVGENLQEHPGAWLTFHTRMKTLNNEKALVKQALHGLNWFLFGRGPATTAGAQAVAFLRTEDVARQPDIQLHFIPVGYEFLPKGVLLCEEPTVTVLVNVCRPLSRGRISLRAADPEAAPVIEVSLLGHPQDVRTLIAGCRRAREIMRSPAISRTIAEERAPGADVTTAEQWEDYLRRTVLACYHPVGTCRMSGDGRGVVDPQLRVRGLVGLRIADTSIMPTIPSGNTNAAAIMIGEKAADIIRSDRSQRPEAHW